MSEKLAGHGLLGRIADFIGDELREVDEIFRTELQSQQPYVHDVFEHVTHFGGKRLRPMLLLLSASAAGKITHDHKVLAAVVEMIHTATLVHDDVLDEAETRRHLATVNARWNSETSVLFGDFLFTHAFHLASSLESTLACRLIGRATNIVCEGELAQVRERGNFDLAEQEYIHIIDAKTAELCALSCYLGGHFAGTTPERVEALTQYGRALGIAFQIADDLLDILGSEQETGKSLGTDFVKQKLTMPVIRLLSQADAVDTARIRDLLSRPSEDSRAELAALIERSDALEYTRGRALQFVNEARRNLQVLPESPARAILDEVTEFAVHRAF